MHEDTQYNVNCGAGEPTREEHLCCKERQGTCVMIRQKNLAFAGVPKLEKRLSKKQFFRCHNSYMVNFDYVEGVKKDSVLIKDKVQKLKTIPISKYKKEEFMRALARYVGKWEN